MVINATFNNISAISDGLFINFTYRGPTFF